MTISVTNTSDRIRSFTTNTGARVHIEPGETKSIALERDDSRIKALENARLIMIGEDAPKSKAKKAETKVDTADTE